MQIPMGLKREGSGGRQKYAFTSVNLCRHVTPIQGKKTQFEKKKTQYLYEVYRRRLLDALLLFPCSFPRIQPSVLVPPLSPTIWGSNIS